MTARILLVHDKKVQQDQMKGALAAHEVLLANDAHQAMLSLKQIEDAHLDIVPLDLIVSCVHIESTYDLSVFDLLKWTRGNPQIAQVPFILICSEPSSMARSLYDSVRLAGHSLGASAYMVIDDFDAASFLAQIEYYLPDEKRSLKHTEHDLRERALDAAPDRQNRPLQSESAATEIREEKHSERRIVDESVTQIYPVSPDDHKRAAG